MQIARLEIGNFLSYESAQLDLKDRGLLLVEGENRDQGGSNGAGKTTLFEAICWCVFGCTLSGVRGDDVVRLGASNTRVSISLLVDGRRVVAARHRKHSEFGNELHLEIEGVDSRGATTSETQASLLKLIQLDWASFVAVVMFPQGASGIASWTDAEQKTVLDVVLDLGRFRDARSRTMLWLTADSNRLGTLETKLALTRQALDAQHKELQRLVLQSKEFDMQLAQRVSESEARIEALRRKEPPPSPSFDEQVASLQRQIEDKRCQDTVNMAEQVKAKTNMLLREQSAAQAKRSMLAEQLKRLPELKAPEQELAENDNCPSCGQTLPEEARQELLREFEAACEKNTAFRLDLKDRAADFEKKLVGQDSELVELRNLSAELNEKLESASELQGELREVERQRDAAAQEHFQWEQMLKQARAELQRVSAHENPFVELIEPARERVSEIEVLLDPMRLEQTNLEESVELLSFWKDGFGNRGVKSLLMSTVTPFLNERANEYMAELSDDSATISISTQKRTRTSGEMRDKLDFTVSYPGSGNLYAAKSGGERRRADIAILFALRDLAASRATAPVSLSLLDEPFESLDALGCEQVVNLLNKHVVPKVGTVLVMTHSDSLKPLFENRIKVVKERGVSRLEEA